MLMPILMENVLTYMNILTVIISSIINLHSSATNVSNLAEYNGLRKASIQSL